MQHILFVVTKAWSSCEAQTHRELVGVVDSVDSDRHMDEEEAKLRALQMGSSNAGLKYGDLQMGTAEARASAVAKGNIAAQQTNETLDLTQVEAIICRDPRKSSRICKPYVHK